MAKTLISLALSWQRRAGQLAGAAEGNIGGRFSAFPAFLQRSFVPVLELVLFRPRLFLQEAARAGQERVGRIISSYANQTFLRARYPAKTRERKRWKMPSLKPFNLTATTRKPVLETSLGNIFRTNMLVGSILPSGSFTVAGVDPCPGAVGCWRHGSDASEKKKRA